MKAVNDRMSYGASPIRRSAAPLLLLVSAPLLNGCVAALLPLAAAGALGGSQIDQEKVRKNMIAGGAVEIPAYRVLRDEHDEGGRNDAPGTFADQPERIAMLGRDESSIPRRKTGLDRRFAGTAVPQSRSSPFYDFTQYAIRENLEIIASGKGRSAVLMPNVDITAPETFGCGGKPNGVLIDLDSAGPSATSPFRNAIATLADAVGRLRAADIALVWLSDDPAAPDRIAAIMHEAGFDGPEPGTLLLLPRGRDDRKQERRWDAARNYCILAISGDRRSDFDELYDYLRKPDGAAALAPMFGKGWFLTPPPIAQTAQDASTDANDDAE
ncbi:hypothetical protein [Novosphingopyxis sp.]|uniref:hypothetical protein n=1 Tax=Novosphingopyxis sp. TaxID=2709690 RepID=UPI003B5B6CC6